MLEPIEVISYQCPYCGLFGSHSREEVTEHIKTCKRNDTLPKCDCTHCESGYRITTKQRVGHDRGYRPLSEVSYLCCKVLKDRRNCGEYCHEFKSREVLD